MHMFMKHTWRMPGTRCREEACSAHRLVLPVAEVEGAEYANIWTSTCAWIGASLSQCLLTKILPRIHSMPPTVCMPQESRYSCTQEILHPIWPPLQRCRNPAISSVSSIPMPRAALPPPPTRHCQQQYWVFENGGSSRIYDLTFKPEVLNHSETEAQHAAVESCKRLFKGRARHVKSHPCRLEQDCLAKICRHLDMISFGPTPVGGVLSRRTDADSTVESL